MENRDDVVMANIAHPVGLCSNPTDHPVLGEAQKLGIVPGLTAEEGEIQSRSPPRRQRGSRASIFHRDVEAGTGKRGGPRVRGAWFKAWLCLL